MNNIYLEEYLKKLNNNLDSFLSKYLDVIKYDKPEDIEKGLLRFKEIPRGKVFLFILPKQEILHFHTVGMKFPIDIYFFNSNKELVSFYKNVKSGIEDISSKNPAKYVVEVPC